MKFFAPFLTNSVYDFQAPSVVPGRTNIEAMPLFDAGEIQLEFSLTKQNSSRMFYAPGGITPAAYLQDKMDLWFYYDFTHPPDFRWLGDSTLPPESNPYWLRREQLRLAEQHGWYLRGDHWIHGNDSIVHFVDDPEDGNYKKWRPHTDTSVQSALDWMVDAIVESGVKQIVLDDMYLTSRYAHFRPWASSVSDAELNKGLLSTCKRIRDAGVRVVLNAGWEMRDPDADQWVYDALEEEACDGVMCEVRIDGYQGGMSRANDGGFWTLKDQHIPRLAADWRGAGKILILVVRWSANDALFSTYDDLCQHYATIADECGCWFAPANGNYSAPHWLPWFAEYQNEPISMEDAFRNAADANQTISGNYDAALQKAIVRDGYFPVETEFEFEFDGARYMLQKAEDKDSFAPRVYAAPWGRWDEVFFVSYPAKEMS